MIKGNLHLEIQKHRQNHYGLLRTTYWDKKDKKIKHTSHGRLSGLDCETLKLIQASIKGKVKLLTSADEPHVRKSKEYGASYTVLQIAKKFGLDKIIYSKPNQQWVQDSLAMIAGRLIYAGSKLSLSNRYKDTALWELCGVENAVDVEKNCYASMDRLLDRQKAIQKKLAEKHFDGNVLVLYDITSSYFEGEYSASRIVKFGYNRDQKRGHEQMVIGLICTSRGCPIGVEVFPGNTKDETTVVNKISEIQKTYQMEEIIFVGDRGMVTKGNLEKVKNVEGLNTISALTHPQIKELLSRKVIQTDLFDEQKIVEVLDPDISGCRYCLCRNTETAKRETKTRNALLSKTTEGLKKIAASNRGSTEQISARVGKLLGKTKMGKYITWEVKNKELQWSLNADLVDTEQLLDGCYIIASDVPQEKMQSQEIVASYKRLTLVEKAFRNLKTVQLEIRPVYHKTDDRIRCHVFICMLAYYLQWHMSQLLQPLFKADGKYKNRFWTFENVIERLKSIRREDINVSGAKFKIVTEADKDQEKILKLLKIKLHSHTMEK
ncbi:MAG: IS1634 family transposase [Candidatus Aenigmarchaeota archaeon]|nr:IS1634 family transposase [Candidatus Aenigmarchaeota archaeon]